MPCSARGRGQAAEGLPRWRRIRRRADFLRVQNAPQVRVRTAYFLMLGASRAPAEAPEAETPRPTRLGIVASRKVGGAVARNRAKRLIREAFRKRWASLPEGLDLVIIVRPDIASRSAKEVADALDEALPELARRAPAP